MKFIKSYSYLLHGPTPPRSTSRNISKSTIKLRSQGTLSSVSLFHYAENERLCAWTVPWKGSLMGAKWTSVSLLAHFTSKTNRRIRPLANLLLRVSIKRCGGRIGPRHVGVPERQLVCCPFKPIFFKPYRSKTRPANISEGECPSCLQFSESFFCVW